MGCRILIAVGANSKGSLPCQWGWLKPLRKCPLIHMYIHILSHTYETTYLVYYI